MKKHTIFIIISAAAMLFSACKGGNSEETTESTEETIPTSQTTTVTTTVTTTETTTETTVPPEETEETTTTTELPFEDTADNAYQRLYASFISDGKIKFPKDYAGTYGYAGTLFVVITDNEPSEVYTEVLKDYTCVEYKTAKYSFDQLSDISEEAAELLDAEFGVAECFVDVPSNKAGVSIKNGDPKKAQNYLKTIEDKSFTLDQLEISMADPETADEE